MAFQTTSSFSSDTRPESDQILVCCNKGKQAYKFLLLPTRRLRSIIIENHGPVKTQNNV